MNKNLFLIERIVLLFFPWKNKKEMDHREYLLHGDRIYYIDHEPGFSGVATKSELG